MYINKSLAHVGVKRNCANITRIDETFCANKHKQAIIKK